MIDLPPPPPPPETVPRRSRLLPWIALGCLGGLIGIILIAAGLLLLMPQLREELALLVGSSQPAAPPPPEAPTEPSPPPAGLVRLEDDFSAPNPMWELAGSRIADGQYELRVDSANYDSYGLFLGSSGSVSNFDLSVDATQVEGSLEGEFGIRFRQPGPDTYLMVSLSSGGYYRLVRVEDGVYRPLVPWTFDPRIRTGLGATNRIRVSAEGQTLRAWVNGRQIITAEDQTPLAGQLTLGATTFNDGGLVVRFDNLEGQAEAVSLNETFTDAERAPWSVGGGRLIDGQYEIFAGVGVQLLQQPRPKDISKVTDFTLEVDASLADGQGEGVGYGVLFGAGDSFDYLGLLILPDGGVTLYRTGEAGSELLIPPSPFEAVKPGLRQMNRINVEVREEELTIKINGEVLVDAVPIGPLEGEVGMLVASGTESRAVARFDNFKLARQGKQT